MKKNKTARNNPEQSKRFMEAAREAEAAETREGADRAFKKAVRQPKKTRPRGQ
jgi:hypothetical protein